LKRLLSIVGLSCGAVLENDCCQRQCIAEEAVARIMPVNNPSGYRAENYIVKFKAVQLCPVDNTRYCSQVFLQYLLAFSLEAQRCRLLVRLAKIRLFKGFIVLWVNQSEKPLKILTTYH